MLQVIQYQKSGEVSVEDVPAPMLVPGRVLVRNAASLISSGTERTSVRTAKAGWVEKARTRPDLVRQVLDNVKQEGLPATVQKVRTRLDTYKPLGYCSAGTVVESACDAFRVGDRVACGGEAYHAEFVCVPRHLCARVPRGDSVTDEEAAFATLGAIALHAVHQAEVDLGDSVVVIGLGLIGQLVVGLLHAAGCAVIGLDVAPETLEIARASGADAVGLSARGVAGDLVASVTRGRGADSVIIAAGTSSNEPMQLAAAVARDRARIVILGAVRADLPRRPFYEKELEVRMSRSYGPGRYDPRYEEDGIAYPLGYVPWTEQRNMEAVLDLIARGALDVKHLIAHRFPIQEADRAYDVLMAKSGKPQLGVVLSYPRLDPPTHCVDNVRAIVVPRPRSGLLGVGFIGAGNFAQSHLLPHLRECSQVRLTGVATGSGVSATTVAGKFGFAYSSTDAGQILADPDTDLVFIASRHDSHAGYVVSALAKSKAAYVEKPLAITVEELEHVADEYNRARCTRQAFLMIGYNRRFSKPILNLRAFFEGRTDPLVMHYRVNAGPLPKEHWLKSPAQGGRIVGEACHFIDVMQFLAQAAPVRVTAECIVSNAGDGGSTDTLSITIRFNDGSIGTLWYVSVGDPTLPKEYMEVFCEGAAATLDNFRRLTLVRGRKTRVERFRGDSDKGHAEEVAATLHAARNGEAAPITFDEAYDAAWVTFAALESARTGHPVEARSASVSG